MNDDEIKCIKASLQRIELGLFGDEELGHVGVVKTQKEHGQRISTLERVTAYVVGGVVLIGGLYSIVTDWWPRK